MDEQNKAKALELSNPTVTQKRRYPTTGRLRYKWNPKRQRIRLNSKQSPEKKNPKRNIRNAYIPESVKDRKSIPRE